MTKRKLYLLLSLYIILTGAGKAFADFTSVFGSSITASVTFTGKPVITHTGLTQLSQGKYAVISGTAACGIGTNTISSITINYYVSGQTGFSTAAVTTQGLFQQYFSSSILVDMTNNPNSFFYKITAVDNTGLIALWPTAGTFYSFNIAVSTPAPSGPPIVHCPIYYISAIDGIVVATGTAQGQNSAWLNSVGIYYHTDVDLSTSSYIVNLSSHPNVYNFRFELDKSKINFAKAKYFYYHLIAQDSSNSYYLPLSGDFTAQIIAEQIVTLGTNGGSISLPNGNSNDGQTTIVIPQGALDGSTQVTITQVDPTDSSVPPGKPPCASAVPAAVYTFGPENLVFKKAGTMKLLYQDVDHDGIVDGTNYRASSLKVFWWDGFDWRLLGGKKDPNLNLIAYSDVKHFSMYALFPVDSMSDNDYRPKEKIITPATIDNKNDFALFTGLVDGDIVNIFDVRGRKIRQLNQDFSWDGKDDSGRLVESGIYIYQIKLNASGKIISGTVVVAK